MTLVTDKKTVASPSFSDTIDQLRARIDDKCAEYRANQEYEADWYLSALRVAWVYPFVRESEMLKDANSADKLLLDTIGFLRVGHGVGGIRSLQDDFFVVSQIVTLAGFRRVRKTFEIVDQAYHERFGDQHPSDVLYGEVRDQEVIDESCKGCLESDTFTEENWTVVQMFREGATLQCIAEATNTSTRGAVEILARIMITVWEKMVCMFDSEENLRNRRYCTLPLVGK